MAAKGGRFGSRPGEGRTGFLEATRRARSRGIKDNLGLALAPLSADNGKHVIRANRALDGAPSPLTRFGQ